jgi:hypothetical protein
MPSMASGRRAMTELPRMGIAPGVEVNVVMGCDADVPLVHMEDPVLRLRVRPVSAR